MIKYLFSKKPELLSEWDHEKNSGVDYSLISTNDRVWHYWVCSLGHSYKTNAYSKNKGSGCPVCSNRLVLEGFNDLQTVFPEIASEWHPSKNGSLGPTDIVYGTEQYAWWLCKDCGNEWRALICNRTRAHRGCPHCWNRRNTSFRESVVFYYLKKVFSSAEQRVILNGVEVDVFIKDCGIVVEYDGVYWHREREFKDYEKNYLLDDFLFIRIRELGLSPVVSNGCVNIFVDGNSDRSLEDGLLSLFTLLKSKGFIKSIPSISVHRDRLKIRGDMNRVVVTNSVASKFPHLIEEWDNILNGTLTPFNTPYGSHDKVLWRCKLHGHSYPMVVKVKTLRGDGCPICSNRRLLTGFNDLGTSEPFIAQEFHSAPPHLSPSTLLFGSTTSVTWRCSDCGVLFDTSPYFRVRHDMLKGCPVCKKKLLLVSNLFFDDDFVGVRFLYGKNLCDVSVDSLKSRSLFFYSAKAPRDNLFSFNNLLMTELEIKYHVHVTTIIDRHTSFFSCLSSYLFTSQDISILGTGALLSLVGGGI